MGDDADDSDEFVSEGYKSVKLLNKKSIFEQIKLKRINYVYLEKKTSFTIIKRSFRI